MDTYQLLVVLLSVTLIAVLLALLIAIIYIIKILQHMQRISLQAEKVVDKVEHVGEFFKQGVGITSIARMVGTIVESVNNHKSQKGKK